MNMASVVDQMAFHRQSSLSKSVVYNNCSRILQAYEIDQSISIQFTYKEFIICLFDVKAYQKPMHTIFSMRFSMRILYAFPT